MYNGEGYRHKWLPEVRHHMRRVPKLLVVNKCDLDTAEPHEELITDEIINKAFREFRMDDFIKISALTGDNVDELIQKAGRLSRRQKQRGARTCIPL